MFGWFLCGPTQQGKLRAALCRQQLFYRLKAQRRGRCGMMWHLCCHCCRGCAASALAAAGLRCRKPGQLLCQASLCARTCGYQVSIECLIPGLLGAQGCAYCMLTPSCMHKFLPYTTLLHTVCVNSMYMHTHIQSPSGQTHFSRSSWGIGCSISPPMYWPICR